MPIKAQGVVPLLQVYNMHRSTAFYRDVLGFEVLQTHEPDGHLYWAMLKLGGTRIMLNARFEDDERPASEPANTGHNDLTLYFDCPNVEEAYEHLRTKGSRVSAPNTRFME